MAIYLHHGDLPSGLDWGDAIAVDTETLGLRPHRDRLCLIQLSAGDGDCHLVKFQAGGDYHAPNLVRAMQDPELLKIFHFARFDMAIIRKYLGVWPTPVYCTKIASKLSRTYTNRHGLAALSKELLDVELSKESQSSDWAAERLTAAQKKYAAGDVLYLHRIRKKLNAMLEREGRMALAQACFSFLSTRCALDLAGWSDEDIFTH